MSIHEVTLSHWQNTRGFAGEKTAIGSHFVGFRVNLHTGGSAIQHHGMLADLARVRDGNKRFCKSEPLTLLQCGLAHECKRAFGRATAERAKHWPVMFRLRRRNGTVG